MALLELAFESKESSLSVRRFSVREGMSSLFNISVWARSPDDGIDLESIIGKKAELKVMSGLGFGLGGGARKWTGVCERIALVDTESAGLSTYQVHIAPTLWLLTQRRNHRLFQHLSIPDIADKLFAEWSIEPAWKINRGDYPKLTIRTQYGESDFDFLSRLLEEAGISYFFADDAQKGSVLTLSDAPQSADARAGGPIAYADNPNAAAELEYISQVRFSRDVKPGRVVMQDHDFRRKPEFKLLGATPPSGGVEDKLEQYHYAPGSSLVEMEEKSAKKLDEVMGINLDSLIKKAEDAAGKGVAGLVEKEIGKLKGGIVGDLVGNLAGDLAGNLAGKLAGQIAGALKGQLERLAGDDKGFARHDEKAAQARSTRHLESQRVTRFSIDFTTNAINLGPGTVFSMMGHPRADLGPDKRLLITELMVEGTNDGEWSMVGHALFAAEPYRSPMKTPKPTIQGMQSAVVVGPPGEEIHTDEFGRIRVQFHWDREGGHDDNSSCWMRVSQGWAGAGYGMITIPRVGQEVLVSFLEGDPDLPIVTGTTFSNTSRVPHGLPGHKTRSSWRSSSSPGSDGANEIMMDDAKGKELVYMLAERNMQQLVKKDRGAIVGKTDSTLVGEKYSVHVAQAADPPPASGATGLEMVDKKITFTTGEASITLDGPDITIEAKGKILIKSTGGDVVLKGGPKVKINCSDGPPPDDEPKLILASFKPDAKAPAAAPKKKGGKSGMDVDKATKHLDDNAGSKSKHKCAKYTRQAIEAGGVKLARQEDAKDYGSSLKSAGFDNVANQDSYGSYAPQKGDVVVFQDVPGHSSGHMAMYDGDQWVSDYKQNSIYPANAYKDGDFAIYRP
jgi:type VI secretion system secreted protein VgrG